MATEILKSFGTLQSELEQAKNSLKGVDENIKRLIGRDPSTIIRPIGGGNINTNNKRSGGLINEENRLRNRTIIGQRSNNRNFNHENDEPPSKRRNNSVFKRLSDKIGHYDDELTNPQQKQMMISKVIVTPKEVPSRQEALAAQNNDEKFKARNRRMFGALLGTLQKFQQEETKLKPKEDKRAQLEKKIEETEIREKAEIKKERQELFLNRKKKQAEIKMIELKMLRMKEYTTWEERQRPRQYFIQTKAKPHIYYLPRKLNDANMAALDNSKNDIDKLIDKRRQEIFDELQHIEDRMKKNFERKPKQEEEGEENEEKHDAVVEEGDEEEELVTTVGSEIVAPKKETNDIVSLKEGTKEDNDEKKEQRNNNNNKDVIIIKQVNETNDMDLGTNEGENKGSASVMDVKTVINTENLNII